MKMNVSPEKNNPLINQKRKILPKSKIDFQHASNGLIRQDIDFEKGLKERRNANRVFQR
jgi:hypothetical protein